MSEINAMYAIAKQPVLKPYISPKRLERVAKCCEHYQNLGYSEVRQTSNILKRVHLAETSFSDKLIAQHPGQFERFIDTEVVETAQHTDKKALKALKAFNAYLTKVKDIIGNTIVNNRGLV